MVKFSKQNVDGDTNKKMTNTKHQIRQNYSWREWSKKGEYVEKKTVWHIFITIQLQIWFDFEWKRIPHRNMILDMLSDKPKNLTLWKEECFSNKVKVPFKKVIEDALKL